MSSSSARMHERLLKIPIVNGLNLFTSILFWTFEQHSIDMCIYIYVHCIYIYIYRYLISIHIIYTCFFLHRLKPGRDGNQSINPEQVQNSSEAFMSAQNCTKSLESTTSVPSPFTSISKPKKDLKNQQTFPKIAEKTNKNRPNLKKHVLK